MYVLWTGLSYVGPDYTLERHAAASCDPLSFVHKLEYDQYIFGFRKVVIHSLIKCGPRPPKDQCTLMLISAPTEGAYLAKELNFILYS